MFQAEVCHPADDEAEEILVGPQGRRHDCVEDVHGAAQFGFRHQRQIDELLDRATPDLAPDTLVFLLDLLLRRLRGPLDTRLPQIVEACLDSAAAPAERCEQLFRQPRDGGQVHEPAGALGQPRESPFRCCEVAGQEFALCTVQLQREGECAASLPAVLRQQRAAGTEIGQS